MRHIALVAPMHSGKTTLANLLVERGYTRIALADDLKQIACHLLNAFIIAYSPELPARQLDPPRSKAPILIDRQEIEDNKEVFRPYLQWFGSEFVREHLLAESFWLDRFRDRVQNTVLPVVCDDVRFPNEAFALKALGFDVIRLIRPEEDRLADINQSGRGSTTLTHNSETELTRITADLEFFVPTLAGFGPVADRLTRQ
jgi:hypothetical protein